MKNKGGVLILQYLIQRLQMDNWEISYDAQWVIARREQKGILISTLIKGNFLHPLREDLFGDSKIQWEAFVFCPEGLFSNDLKQPALRGVQAWYIDLQTGLIFPAPATTNRENLNILLSYLQTRESGQSSTLAMAYPKSSMRQRGLTKPILTYSLMAINFFVFLLLTLDGGSTNTYVLVKYGAKVNELIRAGEVWRLLTSMFLHIGIIHLAFNSFALYALGPLVEELAGRWRFILIYISSGIMGSLASFYFTNAISAGASGAIFGLLGALVAYSRKNPALWKSGFGKNLVVIIVLNLSLGIMQPGIDNFAHLGGLFCGFILGFISMK
ncbi:MAG: rhomboid family intramembrane serine protease [Desulfitobacterium sp.]|nr:rhomboid family intramembrane serine protease [Desulfitobacterium sp.]